MKRSTKEEKEREEIEIERKVWSTCFLCEEEYEQHQPTNNNNNNNKKKKKKEEKK